MADCGQGESGVNQTGIGGEGVNQLVILSDEEREAVIDTMTMLSQAAATQAQRHHWFGLLRQEIARRSLDQVRRMEIEKGLRAA